MCLGVPGRIVEIVDAEHERAVIDVDGVRREISVALLGIGHDDERGEKVDVGDWVLVHVGFAMAKIDEAEAAETLAALRQLGEIYDQELGDMRAAP